MAYGIHWEWRGFGALDPEVERRITALPAGVPERSVTDRYLWAPGATHNVKIRAWPGGGSLKVKRLLSADDPSGPSLWQEDPDEDYPFPIAAPVLGRALAPLGLELTGVGNVSIANADALVDALAGVSGVHRIVEVRKRRRTFEWRAGAVPLLVELAEIEAPERTASLGLEDAAGLSASSPDAEVAAARGAVAEAIPVVGGSLRPLTYLQAVAEWARGGSVAR